MTEQSTDSSEQQNTPKRKMEILKPVGPFASLDEAKANQPSNPKYRLISVSGPDGKTQFVWARYRDHALLHVVRKLGFTATEHGKGASREKVSQLLGQLSQE